MIDSRKLLSELQAQQRKLEADLRQQIKDLPELKARLQGDYKKAFEAGRTADTFGAWSDNEVTQGAVAWLLACTFVRFCEDNRLIPAPMIAGPGDALRRARDAASEFFRQHPTENERHYLEHCFDQMAAIPAITGLFDRAHNPLFALPISFEAARALLAFWQRIDPDRGHLLHDFRDEALNTRFLGDLYQDLSEAARKRYALLQTPVFVEEFILDRTLTPAIQTFGLKGIRLIDPTCGSGHFLLGAFQHLLDAWRKQAPGLDAREHVIEALSGVYGVDLNPFAVAIARFRLLVAALQASGIGTVKEAPKWTFNLTTGDSLLHGPRLGQGELPLADTGVAAEYAHVYAAEDWDEIHRILGQHYHAVVGNPPYITASDKALNLLYRERYTSCHRKFSLGVPFTERFFQLAFQGGDQPAGYVGLITADSFMKREFGKKLIEDYLSRQDLTHLIHTSVAAHIPGHKTPTVILFGRNRRPTAGLVRAVLPVRGEPNTPEDPAQGLVWASIVALTDRPGCNNEFISVSEIDRERLAKHPWSLHGGAAQDVLKAIGDAAQTRVIDHVSDIGFGCILGEDDAFMVSGSSADPRRKSGVRVLPLVQGDTVRDWRVTAVADVLFPYDDEVSVVSKAAIGDSFWPLRALLETRNDFTGKTYRESGRHYWSYHQIPKERNQIPLTITFAEVASHNHFVLDRGGKVFNQTAPVIKLAADASVEQHLGLLGLLNSSTSNFWMRERCFNKGVGDEPFADRIQRAGTQVGKFPVPNARPISIAEEIDRLARAHDELGPASLLRERPVDPSRIRHGRSKSASIFAQMVALQEELDWWCYRAYGLIDEAVCSEGPLPAIQPGERAFEIVLAREMAAEEVQTAWFERHGSTPITEVPAHWPANYRALVERRIALIESNDWIGLLERPEYKRRWNQPSWEELEQAALKGWLLDRLETPAYWSEPALQSVAALAANAERDSDFMAVAALYTGQPGFDVPALVLALLKDESVPALKVLRYKESGLRKRADWEQTWELQRREDAIDAAVAAADPRRDGESEADWQARIKPLQDQRKAAEVGRIAAPPKYISADFLAASLWRLRGGLDVPKERFFTVPDPQSPADWLYGWAGWNPAQRVRALAASYLQIEQGSGVDAVHLIPLLAAIDEELPWVLQWHNAMDPELDVRPGDYFRSWLGEQLNRHGWTSETLASWKPVARARGRRARVVA